MLRYRPLVGITTQTLQAIEGIPEGLPTSVVMNQRYYLAAAAAGAVPVLIPLLNDDTATLREIYERLDGVLIPGGVDMDPSTYGEEPHEKLGHLDRPRDGTELQLARWAIAEKKPLLGLCRGVQVMNVACGGTLYQDIEAQIPGAIKHDCFPQFGFARDFRSHEVALTPGSKLRATMDVDRVMVNSLHHQSINKLGARLRATAVAPDGVVEGVELDGDGGFAIGVQWHPEAFDSTDRPASLLFQAFVREAEQYRMASRTR
jgi:putative glutamine amidotransferase